jgi:hypothetical protein
MDRGAADENSARLGRAGEDRRVRAALTLRTFVRARGGRMPVIWRVAAAAAALCVAGAPGSARAVDHLHSDEPEAWAMFYFTSVTLFSGLGVPRSRDVGSVEAALEVSNIPHLSKEERTVGFGGVKTEDLNKAPVFVRPRVTIGLPWKVSVSLAYVPPIEVWGLTPHLFAAAIERPLYEEGPWTFGVRGYGQIGSVDGDYTCPKDVTNFPPGSEGNPYGCDGTSPDRAIQHYAGAELGASYRIDALRGLTPYLTVGANYLDTGFRVHAQEFGRPDRTRLVADTWTFSLGTGVSYQLSERTRWSLGLFFTPLWVTRPPDTSEELDSLVNFRTEISFRLF